MKKLILYGAFFLILFASVLYIATQSTSDTSSVVPGAGLDPDAALQSNVSSNLTERDLLLDLIDGEVSDEFRDIVNVMFDRAYNIYPCQRVGAEEQVLTMTIQVGSGQQSVASLDELGALARLWEPYITQDIGDIIYPGSAIRSNSYGPDFVVDLDTGYNVSEIFVQNMTKQFTYAFFNNILAVSGSTECMEALQITIAGD